MSIAARPGYHFAMKARPCHMCWRGDCPLCTKLHRDQRMQMVGITPPGKPEMWLLCPHCDLTSLPGATP